MKQRKAFSLIELAIVLLIIGIIIAGVTQGSRLINAYRLRVAQESSKSSPTVSIPGLILWLDATNENSFIDSEAQDGSTISRWNDIDPHENPKHNAFQSTGALRPTYDVDGINNLPAIRFDGAQYMDTPYTADLNPRSYTIITVVRPMTLTGTFAGIICSRNETSGILKGFIVYISNFNSFQGWFGTGSAWKGNNSTSFTVAAKRTEIFATSYDGTPNIQTQTAYFYRNRLSNPSTYSTSDGPFALIPQTNEVTRIGASGSFTYPTPPTASFYLNGYIGEIIMFNRKLNSEERKAIEDYLAKKWGVK